MLYELISQYVHFYIFQQGDTTVMVTSISKAMKTSPGFMPLTVCYLVVIKSRSEFEPCLFRGVIDTTLCDKFVSDRSVVLSRYSTNKTDYHDITEYC